MLNQGIPVFRLPKLIEKEVKQIIDLGVKVELNKSIDTSSEIQSLSKNLMPLYVQWEL